MSQSSTLYVGLQVVVAIARGLSAFMWAIAQEVPLTP